MCADACIRAESPAATGRAAAASSPSAEGQSILARGSRPHTLIPTHTHLASRSIVPQAADRAEIRSQLLAARVATTCRDVVNRTHFGASRRCPLDAGQYLRGVATLCSGRAGHAHLPAAVRSHNAQNGVAIGSGAGRTSDRLHDAAVHAAHGGDDLGIQQVVLRLQTRVPPAISHLRLTFGSPKARQTNHGAGCCWPLGIFW